MEIIVSQEQGRVPVTVFTLKGPLIANEELEARAQEAFAAGARHMLIDLTGVPYIATAGLRALHIIYTLLRSAAPEESDAAVRAGIAAGTYMSPHLKLLKPTPRALDALKMTGYDMFLEIHRDLKQAIASF